MNVDNRSTSERIRDRAKSASERTRTDVNLAVKDILDPRIKQCERRFFERTVSSIIAHNLRQFYVILIYEGKRVIYELVRCKEMNSLTIVGRNSQILDGKTCSSSFFLSTTNPTKPAKGSQTTRTAESIPICNLSLAVWWWFLGGRRREETAG